MNSLLRSFTYMALAIALGAGIGLTIGGQTASAVTVEDNAGNPDAVVPLADPDDAAGDNAQSSGFSIVPPDQNGNGMQWTIGTPTAPDDGTTGQSQ
jgi:hypothetical protein